jgi:hypothetical protein
LLVNNDPALAGMAAEIVNAWNALGLKTSVVVVDTATFKERLVAGNFDAALVELNLAPNADRPYSLWRRVPADGSELGGMNGRRLDADRAGRREVNGIRRASCHGSSACSVNGRQHCCCIAGLRVRRGQPHRGRPVGLMSDPGDRFRTVQSWHFTQP